LRTVGIWAFGLPISLFVGAKIGLQLPAGHSESATDYSVSGAFSAMLAFACLRVWKLRPSAADFGVTRETTTGWETVITYAAIAFSAALCLLTGVLAALCLVSGFYPVAAIQIFMCVASAVTVVSLWSQRSNR
jgi:hypothetical protein